MATKSQMAIQFSKTAAGHNGETVQLWIQWHLSFEGVTVVLMVNISHQK